ncbi:NAD(P)H-dependent oxidoreductase [Parvibaculaceae bacterium PLY_AMNH_Bact1]|nr:NAD(P)H-dependent oxidoreductase [Parvibaculaceae bacterium PLY_AMNH_Bact1]
MPTLLRIDASARHARSLTRMMSDHFLQTWHRTASDLKVIERDVGLHPPTPISEDWIDAAFTSADQRTSEQMAELETSDRLIAEIDRSDIILMATPMYNYGLPASLKAWVDQVVRVDKTFTFDLSRGDQPLEPIFSGKTLVLLTAAGEFGFGPGGINAGADHLVPHIRTISKYLGTDSLHHIGIEYQEFADHRFEKSKSDAMARVEKLAAKLANRSVTHQTVS